MIQLVAGQNTVISTNHSYRLQLSIAHWNWGVIVNKKGSHHAFLSKEENGISALANELLLNIYDIDSDIEKVIVYISQDPVKTSDGLRAEFNDLLDNTPHAAIDISGQIANQTALNLIEIYRHKGNWKIRCVLQGYSSGLTALLDSYGLKEEKVPDSPQFIKPEQRAPISQVVDNMPDSTLHNNVANIELSWKSPESGKKSISNYFLGEKFKPISDLRIGCFYELNNGQIGIVYSFEDKFKGSFEGVPYIQASRSTNAHLERLDINSRFKHKLNRYLIFVTMMEAYDSWSGLNVEVNFNIPAIDSIKVAPDTLMVKPIYAVAMLDFSDDLPKIVPLNEYFNDLSELNQAFGWGLPFHGDHQDDNRENNSNNEED